MTKMDDLIKEKDSFDLFIEELCLENKETLIKNELSLQRLKGESNLALTIILNSWNDIRYGNQNNAEKSLMFIFSKDYQKWLDIYLLSTDFEIKYDYFKERAVFHFFKREFSSIKNSEVKNILNQYKEKSIPLI